MSGKLKTICLWVKEYAHALRVLGGIFFVLALVVGLFWAFGCDVEAAAFVIGTISTTLFASPSVAEYFLPNRKPIREMTFEEILAFIPGTDPVSDWHGISREWASEMFLKEDPRLRYRAKFADEGIQNENYIEPWANCHPDHHAVGYWYDLYYDGAFLDRTILVSVDGGRASIPPPDFKSGKVSRYDYHVAKIHDSMKTLDEYIRRSKLEVESHNHSLQARRP